MARIIGADAVGMSTAVEVIAAAQAGLKTAGISVVSNMAVGITDEKISHEKVLKVMKQTEQKFSLLLLEFIKKIKKINFIKIVKFSHLNSGFFYIKTLCFTNNIIK